MKVYQVIDNAECVVTTTSLEELGRQFLKLSKKYPEATWFWADELEVK